jgi:hypothetical protein
MERGAVNERVALAQREALRVVADDVRIGKQVLRQGLGKPAEGSCPNRPDGGGERRAESGLEKSSA